MFCIRTCENVRIDSVDVAFIGGAESMPIAETSQTAVSGANGMSREAGDMTNSA